MSKTFKLSGIFLITVLNLQITRIIFSFINLSDNIAGWLFSFVFQVICMGLVPYLLYKLWIDKDNKTFAKDLYLKTKINPLSYVFAILIGVLVFFLNTAISTVWYVMLDAVGYTYVSGVGTIYSSPEVLILQIITSAMLPAIFEELTDRGLLLAVLDGKSDQTKILVTGLMFGILHQNVAQLTPTMFGGLVMAFVAVKCGSIFPAMIVHFLNNFLIIIIEYSRQTKGYIGAYYTAFVNYYTSSVILAFLFWGVAAALLYYTLKQFAKINAPKEAQAKPYEGRAIYFVPKQSLDDDFDLIYGGRREEPKISPAPTPIIITTPSPEAMEIALKKACPKTKWWEYGLLYVSIFAASLTTLFTFIWGLLR